MSFLNWYKPYAGQNDYFRRVHKTIYYMKKATFLSLLMTFVATGVASADEVEFNWNANQGESKMIWVSITAGKSITVNYGDGSEAKSYKGAGAGIANLQTLDHTYADAGNYKVTIKSVEADASITDIDSYMTGITSFKATSLPELSYLSLSESPVTVCDLKSCDKLQEVYLMGTTLTDLDLSGKKCLQKIYLQTEDPVNRKGQLKNVSFKNCEALTEVIAYNNVLENFDLSGCVKLRSFACENNTLKSLDLSGLASLEDARCNNNELETLKLGGCSSLRQLWAYNNSLKSIDASGIATLFRMEVYNNALETLNVKDCSGMKILLANKNKINNLDITGCDQLNEADLSDNALTALDATVCGELVDLRLYNNQIENLKVAGMSKLAILHFHANKIKEIDLSGLTSIESIDANSNLLEDFDVTGITNLYELRLYGNKIPLSSLYKASKIVSIPVNCQMGEQTLMPVSVKTGEEIDLTSESVFEEKPTEFVVIKGENPAAESDYEIADGKLTFKTEGEYDVKMTNEAIQSFFEKPAVVTAHYTVTRSSGIDDVNVAERKIVSIYGIDGAGVGAKSVDALPHGIYIVRYTDGTTAKICR